MAEHSKEFDVGVSLIRNASKLLMEYYNKTKINTMHNKGENSIVTEADLSTDEFIINGILEKFPLHSILSEERGEIHGDSHRWIIDPLDGTRNFASGLPIWGTMLAFEADGIVKFSVISLPVFNEFYTARRGGGSFLNGDKIHVSTRENEFMNEFGMRYFDDPEIVEKFNSFVAKFYRRFRYFGSIGATGCFIASGRLDASVLSKSKSWDIAPSALLVEEAGGMATDFAGGSWKAQNGNYILSNGKVHKQILDVIR